ncbi:hypothetical protein BDQ17DRAFT_632563 [Cyathus striatus]|nr:hypothetical protein BDQ17DRAFT_632563 [Cyathus striatus]
MSLRDIAASEKETNLIAICSLSILLYDYALTSNLEMTYFWPSHWSIVKFLYLLTRFLPFCQQRVSVATWLITAGFLVGELLLALRTWAVLLRTRRSSVLLISAYVGVLVVPCCICLALFLKSLKFELQDVLPSSVVQGCYNTQESKIIIVAWACFLAFDTSMSYILSLKTNY